jgi:hypothetical protein
MKTVTISSDEYNRLRKSSLAQDGSLKAVDAAQFLGISDVRLYQLRKAGVLTSAIVGGKIVFPRKALVEYLAAQTTLGSVA